MTQAHYAVETHTLRRVARHPRCRWIWTKHALEVMSERGIAAPDVQRALMNGLVVLHEIKRDILWRVEGYDADGRQIEVVAAVFEEEIAIKVVTTF